MKIYICTDMEGISGVVGSDFVLPEGRFFQDGRRYLTDDMNACIEACFKGGASEVVIRDGHAAGNNAHWDKLDARATIIQGNTGRERYPLMSGSDAAIMLGYHAMAGTTQSVLEHTFSSAAIQNLWLNDELIGEFGIDAAIFGELGIPSILVTGDDKTCKEAAALVPDIVQAQVKIGYSTQGAVSLSRSKAHALIHGKTIEALGKIKSIKPFTVTHPVTLRREAVERQIPTLTHSPEVKYISARMVETTAPTVEEAFWRLFL